MNVIEYKWEIMIQKWSFFVTISILYLLSFGQDRCGVCGVSAGRNYVKWFANGGNCNEMKKLSIFLKFFIQLFINSFFVKIDK